MTVAHVQDSADYTNLPHVVRRAVQLGVLEAVLVLLFSLASRWLAGGAELAVRGIIVFAGLACVSLLPGVWTRARTVEGIAGAAGIGLGAAFVFLLLDVALLQPIGTYTNRWLEIGGGSNWWYHPVWWMVGTFLPWMGAFALANQAGRGGASSPQGVFVLAVVMTGVLGAIAAVVGFPGASFGLATFAIAFLPALALTALASGRGGDRQP